MIIEGKTIFITGAAGGIGACLVDEFVKRKAKKIYCADMSRDKLVRLQLRYGAIIVPLLLDVTDLDGIKACADNCKDVDILINNAGIEFASSFLSDQSSTAAFTEMAVNYLGPLNLCNAFWETLKGKESAAIVNILSIASLVLIPNLGTYCASKMAAHVLTRGLRDDSMDTSINVVAVYPGYVDTQMIRDMQVKKASAQSVAKIICDEFEAGVLDIFSDTMSKELSKTIDCRIRILGKTIAVIEKYKDG